MSDRLSSPIELILFDLGKVLIDFDFKHAVKNLTRFGLVNQVKIYNLFRSVELAEKWDKGRITSEDFFNLIQKELNLPVTLEQFIPIWNDIFKENEPMVQLAQELARRRKVMILSNTNPWHADHIRKKHSWVNELHGFIASCDVGLMKPDPEIYRLAMKKAGVAPDQTLYIDDLPENVEGARRLGIDAVLFENHTALLRQLSLRNIRP